MLKARFKANLEDSRPINWPVKHPYWESGQSQTHAIVISYADDEQYIFDNWPEATDLEWEEVANYKFTGRFPRPKWFHDMQERASMSGTLEHAMIIAATLHFQQQEIDGTPYVSHIMYVATQMDTTEEKIVAILHDIVEDTEMTLKDLSTSFSERVVKAIDALTKRDDEIYILEYIPRVGANELARVVKIQDLKHNMKLERLGRPPTKRDIARYRKYSEALYILEKMGYDSGN